MSDEGTELPDGQEERERQDAERERDHEERRARLSGEAPAEESSENVENPEDDA